MKKRRLAYVVKPPARPVKKSSSLPDYYGRLLKRQPKPLSAEATRQFWDEEQG